MGLGSYHPILSCFTRPPQPTGAATEPQAYLVNVLAANGVFAALWAVAGVLFRRASTAGSPPSQQLA